MTIREDKFFKFLRSKDESLKHEFAKHTMECEPMLIIDCELHSTAMEFAHNWGDEVRKYFPLPYFVYISGRDEYKRDGSWKHYLPTHNE